MRRYTRGPFYQGGWLGRRRTYRCRKCGDKFQVDTRNPLPEERRLCSLCALEEEEAKEKRELKFPEFSLAGELAYPKIKALREESIF